MKTITEYIQKKHIQQIQIDWNVCESMTEKNNVYTIKLDDGTKCIFKASKEIICNKGTGTYNLNYLHMIWTNEDHTKYNLYNGEAAFMGYGIWELNPKMNNPKLFIATDEEIKFLESKMSK